MIDTGSQVDLITLDVVNRLGIDRGRIQPIRTPLTGFSRIAKIQALNVRFGTKPFRDIKVEVVDLPMEYNVILGHPSLNATQAVVSTSLLEGEIPHSGVGGILGDQATARICSIQA